MYNVMYAYTQQPCYACLKDSYVSRTWERRGGGLLLLLLLQGTLALQLLQTLEEALSKHLGGEYIHVNIHNYVYISSVLYYHTSSYIVSSCLVG